MIGAIDHQCLRQRCLLLRQLLAQTADHRVGAHFGNRIRRIDVLEHGLQLNSLRLRLGLLAAQFADVLGKGALVGVNIGDAHRLLHLAQRLTGVFHLLAQVIELAGEPFRGFHDGIVPALKTLIDESLHQGVRNQGRELAGPGLEADQNQTAGYIALDLQIVLEIRQSDIFLRRDLHHVGWNESCRSCSADGSSINSGF